MCELEPDVLVLRMRELEPDVLVLHV
jgi:hypothetical protein